MKVSIRVVKTLTPVEIHIEDINSEEARAVANGLEFLSHDGRNWTDSTRSTFDVLAKRINDSLRSLGL